MRRGIFIGIGSDDQNWLPFKYENLPGFCFGCGVLGHVLNNFMEIMETVKELPEDEFSYSLALRAKMNLKSKVTMKLEQKGKKQRGNCTYECDASLICQKIVGNDEITIHVNRVS